MIKATMPNGIIVQYHVDIFQGEKLRFPVACFEQLSPDDVFQALLQWYSMKPRVRPIDAPVRPPADLPADPPADPPANPPPSSIITPGD